MGYFGLTEENIFFASELIPNLSFSEPAVLGVHNPTRILDKNLSLAMERFIVKSIIDLKTGGKNSGQQQLLPIKKIDGFKVQVRIHMVTDRKGAEQEWNYFWSLLIDSVDFYAMDEEENEVLDDWRLYSNEICEKNKYHQGDIAGLKKDLEELINSTKTLRIDKLCGRLVVKAEEEEDEYNILNETYKLLKTEDEIDGFEYSMDVCCVCYDVTCTMTECRHRVCFACIRKLEKKYDANRGRNGLSCPMCREAFTGMINAQWM